MLHLGFCTRDPAAEEEGGEKCMHYDFERTMPYPRDWADPERRGRGRQWPRRDFIERLVREAIVGFDWREEIGGPMPAEFGDAELFGHRTDGEEGLGQRTPLASDPLACLDVAALLE